MKGLILKAIIILSVTVAITVTDSCTSHHYDERLVYVENCITDSLPYAQEVLKDIDRESLSNPDRHFYDFLSLKIADKRYEKHKSDSLYLTILDYYQRHKKEEIYPEVLYYGGRVYSDLGDYPNALNYFLDALDIAKPTDDSLRATILSQTGRLLNKVHLYSEADKYLGEAVDIMRRTDDKINLAYDLQLLGIINLNLNNLSIAKRNISEALEISNGLDSSIKAKMKMHLARVEDKLGNKEEALHLIRDVPSNVKPITRDWANAIACETYYSAGVFDTAYIYARRIIDNPKSAKRETAYRILLSQELINRIPVDSLSFYVRQYIYMSEKIMDENDTSQISQQVSAYNYQQKLREAERAQKRANDLKFWVFITICLIIISILTIILIISNYKKKRLELIHSCEKIKYLQESLNQLHEIHKKEFQRPDQTTSDQANPSSASPKLDERSELNNISDVRSQLRVELRELATNSLIKKKIIPSGLLSSEPYIKLQKYIKNNKIVPIDDPLWQELEIEIIKHSPDFRKKLSILMNGNETTQDIQTCILIKYNLTPSAMGKVLSLSPGGIVSRRDTISQKIFDEKVGTKVIDVVIRLL